MRRWLNLLLDRNLLLGSVGKGVTQHDMVREHARAALGASALRERQCALCSGILAATPAERGGWLMPPDAAAEAGIQQLVLYVRTALKAHMGEALPVGGVLGCDPAHLDAVARPWLLHGEAATAMNDWASLPPPPLCYCLLLPATVCYRACHRW